MNKSIALLSALLTLCLSAAAFAQAGNDKVQATAIANVSAVQAGKPFWMGFKFTIEPGWHIYWKNPGDSGLATEVKLTLPNGFIAGELQFPVPQRLAQPGDVVNYAYENEVMLLVQITPPKDLPANGSVKIDAKASWLVCKEDCVPGRADVSLELPAADSAGAANEDLFKEWTAKLPVKQDADDIASSTTTGSIADGNGNGSIKIIWKKKPGDVQFIPGAMKTGDISDVKIVTADNATSITFNIKNKKDLNPITGLVTFIRADGGKMGLEVSIPSTVPPVVTPGILDH